MMAHQVARGMYGFRVDGLADPARLLPAVPPAWPGIRVVHEGVAGGRPAGAPVGVMRFDDTQAQVWLDDVRSIVIERDAMTVRIRTADRISDDALVHPYLGLPATVANRWLGRQVFHGGAFLHRGAAWTVLGSKEAGKSSTLAWLHRRGIPVMSDDLAVWDGAELYAGPRCLDLREEAAAVLGGQDVGELGGRRRWRLRLPDVPGAAPLAGLVYLAWGDVVEVSTMPAAERVLRLAEQVVSGLDGRDAAACLELAALPTLRFTRPRSLDDADDAIGALLAALPAT